MRKFREYEEDYDEIDIDSAISNAIEEGIEIFKDLAPSIEHLVSEDDITFGGYHDATCEGVYEIEGDYSLDPFDFKLSKYYQRNYYIYELEIDDNDYNSAKVSTDNGKSFEWDILDGRISKKVQKEMEKVLKEYYKADTETMSNINSVMWDLGLQ